ncbi:MAG: SHOCT-like domain-containing protein [Candidatus Limnocylindria bacterium]
MPEELETILRLVAEGKLSPDEAAPIIEALTQAERTADEPRSFDRSGRVTRAQRHVERAQRQVERARRRAARATEGAAEHLEAARIRGSFGGGRQLRIRITEHGRQVVNLRIPLAFAETAARMVPGIGEERWDRIREAIAGNVVGPIVDVDDGSGDGVLISVE